MTALRDVGHVMGPKTAAPFGISEGSARRRLDTAALPMMYNARENLPSGDRGGALPGMRHGGKRPNTEEKNIIPRKVMDCAGSRAVRQASRRN